MGERKREIQLLLNADRLNAYGLTVDQVRNAVTRQNVEIPGGQFTSGPADVAVRTMGRIKNVEDFNRIVISYRADGSVITFKDVGRVQDSVQEVRSCVPTERHARHQRDDPEAVGDEHRRGRRPRPGEAAAHPSRGRFPACCPSGRLCAAIIQRTIGPISVSSAPARTSVLSTMAVERTFEFQNQSRYGSLSSSTCALPASGSIGVRHPPAQISEPRGRVSARSPRVTSASCR